MKFGFEIVLRTCLFAINASVTAAAQMLHWTTLSTAEIARATHLLGPVAFACAFLIAGVQTAAAAPPVITTQPQSQVATNGATVTLTVAASSSLPLAFQWKKDGLDLVGETKTNLVLTNVSTNDSGNYSVTARNSEGAATSSNGTLRVVPAIVSVQIGAWPGFPGGIANAVAVSGQFAYLTMSGGGVTNADAGLQIIDVSNPVSPVRRGGFNTGGYARGVQLVGNLAYVADGYAGLQIIDASDPARPVRLGGFDTGGFPTAVQVVGNLAYMAVEETSFSSRPISGFNGGLQIIDVSDPASPVRLGRFQSASGYAVAMGVQVVGNLAYLADRGEGLQIIDVSDPASPVRRGGFGTSGVALGVHVVGNLAYVASFDAGLQIIDVSNPVRPVRRGGFDTSGDAWAVQVLGNLAYLADGREGLHIIDVSNPANPVRRGGFDTSGFALGVQVVGNLAYLADGYGGLQIIDVSNPGGSAVTVPLPANDGFSNRIALSGTSVTIITSNIGTTKEPDEPNHAGSLGGKSIWWTWTAPTNGLVTINTDGSDFDTLLAVYTGTNVSALNFVASNNNSGESPASLVTFQASLGTTYQIAVDGVDGSSGNLTLTLNHFANTPPVLYSYSIPSFLPKALGTIPTPISFSITDNETPAGNLILTGASSNTNLLPNSNIVFGGTGVNRTVTLTPAQGQIGNTTVALTLSDGTLSASRSLNLVVYPVNVNSTVVVWGSDENLQALVPEEALTEVKAIAAGGYHCLVLKTDGTVLGWGANLNGQATGTVSGGNPATNSGPVIIGGLPLSGVASVAAGIYHSLAIKSNGTVVAWGLNNYGQASVPPGLTNVVSAAAGYAHSLALKNDGTVVAWGRNDYGQTSVPKSLTNVIAIASGFDHGMALRNDGSVIAWGRVPRESWFDYDANLPPYFHNVTAIAAGFHFNLGLRSDGVIVAWPVLGFGGPTETPRGLSDVVVLDAGAAHSLALKADGTVTAWGNNFSGATSVPDGLANVIAIDAGLSFSMALRSTATGTNSLLSRLLIERLPGSGQIQFTLIDTLPGRHFEIEASADLENWTPLTSLLSTGSPIRFMDPASTDSKQRFYRTRLP